MATVGNEKAQRILWSTMYGLMALSALTGIAMLWS
jgi:hypothetical protein